VWRLLTARYSARTQQLLACICIAARGNDKEVLDREVDLMTQMLKMASYSTYESEGVEIPAELSTNDDEGGGLVTSAVLQV
jgi:hypothetical protein